MTNETELLNVIRSLNADMVAKIVRANRIRPILRTLMKIRLNSDGSMPTDGDTGQPMTATRRNAIYDACIGQAYLLLGLNEDGTSRNT